ncbi:uncharacterized protein LOC101057750 [Pan troglodytes]|uniref:uncharacterized protein LOC101057750 n=1 Tax=Pan troglodytes TaxID=9598 RepID=UPI003013C404
MGPRVVILGAKQAQNGSVWSREAHLCKGIGAFQEAWRKLPHCPGAVWNLMQHYLLRSTLITSAKASTAAPKLPLDSSDKASVL